MRVGVLGLGSIGLRHAKNLMALGHEVFGFDPDEGRQYLLESYGGLATSREGTLACDRIVVGSPTPHHHKDIQNLRCPALVEKPIANVSVADLDLDHIKLVGYNLRYHSCVKQAKNWLNTGFIGKPLMGNFVLAQYNDKPSYLRDGVVLNWSHEIDLCLHLLGPATLLAEANKNNSVCTMFLGHKNGTASSIHLNYINRREERYFTILGDKGKIHCVLSPYRSAECYPEDGTIIAYSYETTFDDDYVTEMKAFLSDEIGPGCTVNEARAVLDICLGT